ncbi:MAG: peptidase S41 [Bacteroidetes bacterium]|nr:MAG: peptidase S41 [Bacteroidota bacterium]
MKKLLLFACLALPGYFFAQTEKPLWLRYPAISPDGKQILFSYKGDIYKVDAAGGTAIPLTLSEGHDFMPTWSPDGKWVAFASDRNGNYDIYLVPAQGGTAKRLTWYSAHDYPYCFSPDGNSVYYGSSRLNSSKSAQFPAGRIPQLYKVDVKGGKEEQVLSIAAEDLELDKTGTKWIYHDKKGGEDPLRKHQTSSVARDLWLFDKSSGKYTQLTDFAGEDRNPTWSPDEKQIFYLSEKSGSFNVWKMNAENTAEKTQVTRFEKNPVRSLSVSTNGTLCFGYDGEIYTQNGTAEPVKVNITIISDERYVPEKNEIFTGGATEMEVSPGGKETVFVVRGEVFVTSAEGGVTKRITSTPGQERSVSFSPDGRSILYAAERNNIWGLYQTSLARAEEKQFFNSTVLKEEVILSSNKESFQPRYSPDGTEVAFIEDRTAIKIINLKTKAVRMVVPAEKNYSYSDGDQWFDWSPDGKYLLVQFLEDNHWLGEIGLVETSGTGKLVNLTQSGYDNGGAKWMMNGKMMIWFSNRHGMKNHGSHGWQSDVYGMFFTREAHDRFKMSKEDFALIKEQADKEAEKKKNENKETPAAKTEPVKIDFDGLEFRKERLTIHSSNLSDAILSKDGEQLYYLCKFDKGYDLWVNKMRDHETKLLLKLDAGWAGALQLDKEGKTLFLLSDGNIIRINLDKNEKKEVPFRAEMRLNLAAERAYMYEHAWRQAQHKFYVTDMQGVDWKSYKDVYAKFLPHINNNRDFAELLSELLGELNASHTGGRFSPRMQNPDETAALGVFYDDGYNGNGVKIAEVMNKGPLQQAGTKIKAGVVIEKIDGENITAENTIYKLLNRKSGKPALLSLLDETGRRWEETVKPISQGEQNELLYQRWVAMMQEQTDKLSKGRLGYVHVRGMDDAGFRAVYEQAMGKYPNREALIVDTRFNGGGWLHDDLATFLAGKKYMDFVPRERKIGSEPGSKWSKPSVVLICEANYSDAHMFPYTYKALGIGKLIGMPVPGTGTAVWWETMQDPTMVFGIPQVGVVGPDGKYLENNQLEPDIKVMNEPAVIQTGRDQQLEKAVEELLRELGK